MRLLLSPGSGGGDPAFGVRPTGTVVHDVYAHDWVDAGGVRINFVASTDGAASAGGLSRGLQTPGDNTVFAALRDLADVVVAGAGTVLAERYRPVVVDARRAAIRRAYGMPATLATAVVTAALSLTPQAPVLQATVGAPRTIVLTCAAAGSADERAALAEFADIVDCGDERVDMDLVRAALAGRGYRRILCEGGPHLFASMYDAGAVDELCLSISPLLSGPGAGRITAGQPWDHPRGLTLYSLLEEDGALFLRYRSTGD